MRKIVCGLILLTLSMVACHRITHKITPEEETEIRQSFERAVTQRITKIEGRRISHFGIYEFKQLANDKVRLGYEVSYHKSVEGDESAEVSFKNKVSLKKDRAGIWQAYDMDPDQLTLGFSQGMQVRAPASAPSSAQTESAEPSNPSEN